MAASKADIKTEAVSVLLVQKANIDKAVSKL